MVRAECVRCLTDGRRFTTHSNDFEAGDSFEVVYVRRRHPPPDTDRGGRDEPIVGSDVCAARREIGPQSCVGSSRKQVEVEYWYDRKDRLHECFAARAMFGACAVHAV